MDGMVYYEFLNYIEGMLKIVVVVVVVAVRPDLGNWGQF